MKHQSVHNSNVDQSFIGDARAYVQSILTYQTHALADLIIPSSLSPCIDYILACRGHIIFSGIGKSGLIARKLAATFASVGIPAFFLHPAEAMHGDIGMITSNDIFFVLSKSGIGEEFSKIIPIVQQMGAVVLFMSCVATHLTQRAQVSMVLNMQKEAGILDIIPTTSTLLMLAVGDAIALTVSAIRGFSREDFAWNHPSGSLGRTLLTTVSMLMHQHDLPLLRPCASFQDIISVITSKKLGVAIVVDEHNRVLGIITDGDLRRASARGPEVFHCNAGDIMHMQPHTIAPHIRAQEALRYMETHRITSLIVTQPDTNIVTGLIHVHDIVQAGISV